MAAGLVRGNYGVVEGEIGFTNGPPWVACVIEGASVKDVTSIAYSYTTFNNNGVAGPTAASAFLGGRLLVLEGAINNLEAQLGGDGSFQKPAEPYRESYRDILLDLNLSTPHDLFNFIPGEIVTNNYDTPLSIYLAAPRWATSDPLWASSGNVSTLARLCVRGNRYSAEGRAAIIDRYTLR